MKRPLSPLLQGIIAGFVCAVILSLAYYIFVADLLKSNSVETTPVVESHIATSSNN